MKRPLTPPEELACSISHGIGLVASVIGLPVLVMRAAERGDVWQIVGGAIFGTMLILLYTASTVYHACPPHKGKALWRVLDHSAIYLLIAGTYTPFMLGALRGPWGWSLLVTVWVLAVAGILFKAFWGFRFPKSSAAFYLAMGWLVLIAFGPLTTHVAPGGVGWLLAGGLSYSAGVIFFAWRRLLFGHLVWHLFVMAGSVCHFFAVLWYSS